MGLGPQAMGLDMESVKLQPAPLGALNVDGLSFLGHGRLGEGWRGWLTPAHSSLAVPEPAFRLQAVRLWNPMSAGGPLDTRHTDGRQAGLRADASSPLTTCRGPLDTSA